jgi:hypothetical protein
LNRFDVIASYTNNFIFIKTRKTAGTSVEIVLSLWCSGRDVCSKISAEDEITRLSYGGSPRNFCHNPEVERAHLDIIAAGNVDDIARANRQLRKATRFRPHQSAAMVRDALPDLWESAFRFTISRHPYEVVVSQAFWALDRRFGGDASNWSDALETVLEECQYLNHELYSENGQLLVDKVLRFENLWSELGQIATERFHRTIPSVPPQAKTRHRKDHRPASEILTDNQKSRIVERCKFEFELMGYEL